MIIRIHQLIIYKLNKMTSFVTLEVKKSFSKNQFSLLF